VHRDVSVSSVSSATADLHHVLPSPKQRDILFKKSVQTRKGESTMANGEERTANKSSNVCLELSLQPISSQLRASDGREIPFTRAMLTIRNVCEKKAVNLLPHATLGQEGGTIQDVTSSLSPSASGSIPPKGAVSWDVYDLLLPAHPGTASKIHMFGYRAALNWRFDLAAWVEYRSSDSPEPLKTPVVRWSLHWSVADPATGAVGLTIDEIKN
jgi:hypothetical protein